MLLPQAVQPQQILPLGKNPSGKIPPHQGLVPSSSATAAAVREQAVATLTAVAVVVSDDDSTSSPTLQKCVCMVVVHTPAPG